MATLIAVVAMSLLALASTAHATTLRSSNVLIVLGEGTPDAGELQTAGSVQGVPQDSFEQFSFVEIAEEELNAVMLAGYDTLVLNQVFTQSLTAEQQQAISQFVTAGGKLIIHDADGTEGNNYQWLPVPARSGESCENCGNVGTGSAKIVENNTLVSDEVSSPYYINVDELALYSDAVGDANVIEPESSAWDVDIEATNENNVEGMVDAYASDGGLIIYNGFDSDAIEWAQEGEFPSGIDWIDKMFYQELMQQWNPDNLPHSNPAVGGGRCSQKSLHVGVVSVCAQSITGSTSETLISGKVVLDGGVSVGEGPLAIDQQTKTITASSPLPITLLRGGAPMSLGSAAFTIEAAGTTEPISGAGGVAKISLTGAQLGPLGTLSVAGLPLAMPSDGSLTMYLDEAEGGGLVGAASASLSTLGKGFVSSGSLSVGVFAGSNSPAVVLGGSASFGEIDLGGGWKFDGLQLSYQQPTATWSVSGGFAAPIGSLDASGSVVAGHLESLGVTVGGLEVPLGESGFFLSEFSGSASGLAKGPLKLTAGTGGFWGAPRAPIEPFYLDKASLTIDFGGSVAIDGAVNFILKDKSPVHGDVHLELGLSPFRASGKVSLSGELPGVSLKASGAAGFTTKHFTAIASGSLSAFSVFSGKGEVIASDAGLGGDGTLCAKALFLHTCKTLAFAGSWNEVSKFDLPKMIGGQPQKLITVPGVASLAHPFAVRMRSGETLLLLGVRGGRGAPAVVVRAPDGHVYRKPSSGVSFMRQRRFDLTIVAVFDPAPGLWHVLPGRGVHGRFSGSAETVGSLGRIATRPASPTGSKRKPLSSRAHVSLRWLASRLPRSVRVKVVDEATIRGHKATITLAENRRASGRIAVPIRRLAGGRNRLALIASEHGVAFEHVAFAGSVWKAKPRSREKPGAKGHSGGRH